MASTLTVDNIVGATTAANVKLPAGCILQVLEGSFDTQTDVSSTSYVDSGLSVVITPKFSTSKIYVVTNVACFNNGTGFIGVQIVRNSSAILNQYYGHGYSNNQSTIVGLTKLDSPATTSATTYKVQIRKTGFTGTPRINQQTGGSRITVMEVSV